jgi:hypothetical protein
MWTKKDALEKIGCLQKAAGDEPVFIVRGQDITMPATLEAWATLAEEANGGRSNSKTIEARAFANEVREWQQKHGAKVPD